QEAAKVLGRDLRTEADAEAALAELAALGSAGVLLTGGHGGGDTVSDRLFVAGERRTFSGPRLAASPHGTGCALSTAVAVGLGAGLGLAEAVERAVGYVRTAVAAAVEMGRGAPLLDHRCAGSSRRGI
ncbi:MAG: bifunctional hydroxymethylpyrimidine kinase/phosphomethylpyrimidine kinase, partial [Thermoanaerobaculia bacterium]|nr:bifunctional hydroxymethylpyrimidine kinase/phosphomethylpyrimidine kinase [Thermoanaerobaculia bacterium]